MSDRFDALRRHEVRYPDDPSYMLEALRAAWRRGALDDAEMWLDCLPEADRAAWLSDVRSRLDLADWLGGIDRTSALRWLHRFVPWTEVRVVIHDESQNRKGAMPLIDSFPWICADHTLHLTEPCGLPWSLEWSPRAAHLLACDCAERAIDHTERVLSSWESRRPDDMRPRRAIEAARACVSVVRRGGSTREMSEARTAAYAAYAAAAGRCKIEVPAAERAWQAEHLWDYLCGVAK